MQTSCCIFEFSSFFCEWFMVPLILLFKATYRGYHRSGQRIKIDCAAHGSQLNRRRLNYRYMHAYGCVCVQFCLSSRPARSHVRCSLSAQTVTYFRTTIYWLENGRPNCFRFFFSTLFFAIKNASAEARYENPMRQALRWSSLNYRSKVSTPLRQKC